MLIELDYPDPVPAELEAEKALLLIIDMENENAHPDGVELIEELRPGADEPLIVKRTHDCFYQTEMDSLLERLGMRRGDGHVIVTGISTRNCVQSAVMGFSVRDYHVYVPIDCTAQRDEREVLQAFSLFTSFGYRHNVTMTRSDLIKVRPLKVLP